MNLFDFSARDASGHERSLREFESNVCLVVNTATRCGFAGQFEGLEHLHRTYRDQGLRVLAFPCNQFRNQEPGSDEEIADFCTTNYNTTFDIFAKIDVNGESAHPLFTWLTQEKGGLVGDKIAWNFTKFLVGRDGHVIKRFAPPVPPARIAGAIEKALAVPAPRA